MSPQSLYRLEERIANSAPVRQFARTVVALIQRTSWELKQIKSSAEKQGQLGQSKMKFQEEIEQKLKSLDEMLKKKMGGKM